MGRRRVWTGMVVGALAVAGVVAALLLTRGQSDDELLREAAESLATTPLPNVGLGEASPPAPDALRTGWRTDFERHSVPFSEISSGGPPKDGIPPVDAPRFAAVRTTDYLADREPVIELVLGGHARAYPLQILTWHEIVNDELGGTPVAVTFCPLCNTAIVFDRWLDGQTLDFGTTGNLRFSDLVMYDRQTESWWQQFSGKAIVGELTDKRLEQIPARIVAWQAFREAHPDGEVLTTDTGHSRSYGSNPYTGYDNIDSSPFFAVPNGDDDRLPPKERVVYMEVGEDAVAIPYSALKARGRLAFTLGGESFEATWKGGVVSALDEGAIADSADIGSAAVTGPDGPAVFHEPFWFAVAAFRPDVKIIR